MTEGRRPESERTPGRLPGRPRQILLPVDFPVRRSFKNFIVSSANQSVVEHLRHLGSGETGCGRQIALWGRRGVGKTHLLQAVCQEAAAGGLRAAWVPLKRVLSGGVAVLEGMEDVPVVCIDDIDVIGRNSDWQFALFRLINRLRARDHILLTASRESPREMKFLMRDLSSRLLWGAVYAVEAMTDEELMLAMGRYAESRHYALTERATQYMLNNFPRDLTTLTEMLDRLGELSREENCKITVPLVKRLAAAESAGADAAVV